MENGAGVDVGGGECGDGNGELEVRFGQEREKKEESGLIAFASAVEGNKDFGDGNAKLASDVVQAEDAKEVKRTRGRPRKNRTEGENKEIKEEKPLTKNRGRPPLSSKKEVSITVVMEQNAKKKRGRPPLSRKEEVGTEVIMVENAQKKRGRPRKNREEPQKKRGRPRKIREGEVGIEKLGNYGVEHVNNESMGNGELAGEEEGKGLNLEHNNAREAVQENGVAEKEGKEVEEENDRRSDEWEKRKIDSGRRNLGERKSRTEAQMKIMNLRVEDEEFEEEMRITKRTRCQKRHEKGVGFEENGGESEVNKGAVDGGNKKPGRKPGRKPSKVLEEQEENGGRAGEFVDEKEKDQEGVDKKKVGRRQSKGKGEQEEVEERQSLSNYSLRVKKADTEAASKPKRLEDENGNSLSNMCHQCQRNDKGRVVRCTKCRTKRYCVLCLNRWYAMHANER